jgi:hypothetical protein
MKWLSLTLALIGLVAGVFAYWGGLWLVWDWANSVIRPGVPWIDWGTFCRKWIFYAPLFLYRWTCETWTGPYDLAKGFVDVGALLIIVSSFCLGYFARPSIEKLLKRLK